MSGSSEQEDVVQSEKIWEVVCNNIKSKLLLKKAVKVMNIGTFGISHCELSKKNGYFSPIHRPVFQLSLKIRNSYDVFQRKFTFEESIHLTELNICELSFKLKTSRKAIEDCIQNIFMTICRYLYEEKFVELIFIGIGKLVIDRKKAKFCFFNAFLNEFDSSGKIAQSLKNRPNTSDSAISNDLILSNKIYRPVNELERNLDTINEDHLVSMFEHDKQQNVESDQNSVRKYELGENGTQISTNKNSLPCSEQTKESKNLQDDSASNYEANIWNSENSCPKVLNENKLNVGNSPKSTGSVYFHDSNSCTNSIVADLNESIKPKYFDPQLPKLGLNHLIPHSSHRSQIDDHYPVQDVHYKLPSPRNNRTSRLQTGQSIKRTIEELEKRLPQPASNCDHLSVNQDHKLCYVCHQRNLRNNPVDMKTETKEREDAEEKLLHAYQILRAENEVKKEQDRAIVQRNELMKQAAYNLGIADAKQSKKNYKSFAQEESFIFSERPPTPSKSIKQNELRTALDEQVYMNKNELKRINEDEQILDKSEQMKLVEELNFKRKQMYEFKLRNQTAYKEALDFQIEHKPEIIPKIQDNSLGCMFKIFDSNDKKLEERLCRAKSVQKYQLLAIEEKKKKFNTENLHTKQEEAKILKQINNDLILDALQRKNDEKTLCTYLQNEWFQATKDKKERDRMEQMWNKISAPTLLLDQTNEYHRCGQCKRRLDNTGQSQMTTDTYVRGAHFVI